MSKYDYDLPFVESDDDIIVIKHLTKHFPVKTSLTGKVLVSVKAVNDVSIKIRKGTTLGVVGESGCGKTTMGRTMLRLYDITSGEVIYKGLDLTKLSTQQLKALISDEDSEQRKGTREEILAFLDGQSDTLDLHPRMNGGAVVDIYYRKNEAVARARYFDYAEFSSGTEYPLRAIPVQKMKVLETYIPKTKIL